MAYKSLATFLTGRSDLTAALPAAIEVARLFDGHLAVCALGVEVMPPTGLYMGAAPMLLVEQMGRAQETAQALEAAAADRLRGVPLRWSNEAALAPFGGVADLVGLRARYADLVIQPRPYGPGAAPAQETVIEAALFDAGVPVLVAPPEGLPPGFGARAVIGWNRSAEAMAAIRAALPLLERADLVSVAVVDPPPQSSERSDPGGQLTQWLARHGVRAEVAVLARTLPRASDVLMRHVADLDASILVVGAYGRSRLREALLGGTTRELLHGAKVPVLLAR